MVKHIKLSSCHSTQDELKAHPEDRVLISTELQTRGRGRGDHTWDQAQGSLAFSFSCAPHPQLTWQSLEVAVLLREFISKKFEINLQLKWPNDLYYQNKKCGGILLHNHDSKMNIGIGLNLLSHGQWTGFLNDNFTWDKKLSHEIPLEFYEFYLSKTPLDPYLIKELWLSGCFHLNKNVALIEGKEMIDGIFIGIGDHGEAIISGKSYYNGSLKIKDL